MGLSQRNGQCAATRNAARSASLKNPNLLDESSFIVILMTSAIIICVDIALLCFYTFVMVGDARKSAIATADEFASLIEQPLYAVDDEQSVRIASALLASGRISGIRLVSSATGTLIDRSDSPSSFWFRPLVRDIRYNSFDLGEVTLFFDDNEIERLWRRFAVITALTLVAVLVCSALLTRVMLLNRVKKAFSPISEGIGKISAGSYDRPVPLGKYVDVNTFIELINTMSSRILSKNAELVEANEFLEQRVAERTSALESSLAQLHDTMKNLESAQTRLVLTEKLSVLGQLAAGIVHELNTPIGAVLSASGLLCEFGDSRLFEALGYYAGLDRRQREVFDSVFGMLRRPDAAALDWKEKKTLQQRFESSGAENPREMADLFGDAGISDGFDFLFPFATEHWFEKCVTTAVYCASVRRTTAIIQIAAQKMCAVTDALRSYLSEGGSASVEPVDISAEIDTILLLLHNKIKHNVTVVRDFGGGLALGSRHALNQVWINLINNALQAMNYKGTLTVKTNREGKYLVVRIGDTGMGIDPSIRERIFEPFFTTKKFGEGIGLGLDICKRIIEQFDGEISFESRPGNTEFTVRLLAAD
jgi:signal transduction histidine kinase